MEKGKLRDKCPACNVLAKMFEDYTEKMSPKRKLILSLDLHPVMVHFPQAFTATILLLSILSMIVHGMVQSKILATIQILAIALPFTVAAAFVAGIIDGKVRFRKVTTPLLVKKMIVGTLFFVIAVAMAVVAIYQPVTPVLKEILLIVMSGCALCCGSILGLWGVGLLEAKFPG